MKNMIFFNNVSKKYGNYQALKNIELKIKKGEIFGLVGKNGAGKTTTLKILAGLIHMSEGSIEINGDHNIYKCGDYLKNVGSLIETPAFYENMSAIDNLRLRQLIKGSDDDLYGILDRVGLKNVSKKKVRNFSLGMKQRLGIAMALIGNPEILILDEPINGLDPQGILEIRKLIVQLKDEFGMTIIVSSHILEELSKVVDSYAIIDEGNVIRVCDSSELNDETKCIKLSVDDTKKAVEFIREKYDCELKKEEDYLIVQSREIESGTLNKQLVTAGIVVNEIIREKESLESVYLQVIEEVEKND